MSARLLPAFALLAGCATAPATAPLADASAGQRAWAAACGAADEWDKPGPPFRIHGDTYYVGTCGITALLVTGPDGHTVLDSGTDKGAAIVLANIRALGFDPRDVKTLFMTHEHFDHVGGMARLQEATGATVLASAPAAAVLRSGRPGPGDPQANSGHPAFPPVTGRIVEIESAEGQRALGKFRAIFTPGHTLGALSWTWQECEGAECKSVVYADSLNPISSDRYRFSDHPALVKAFRGGLVAVGGAPCDILIAPHPVAANWRARLLGEKPLIDPASCRDYAAAASARLDKRLADEARGG
ncbi:MAG: subclass B3 metallo-beta-lactamase [Cypionkella sp.]